MFVCLIHPTLVLLSLVLQTAGGNQQKEAIVLKPAQLAPDLMMKRFWASVDYPFNHFTGKMLFSSKWQGT